LIPKSSFVQSHQKPAKLDLTMPALEVI